MWSRPVLAQQGTPESRVKAAVIAKLAGFVTWPPAAVANQGSINLCVAAPNRFGADLSDLAAGERVDGRPLAVRVVHGPEEVGGCHLLYVPPRAGGSPDPLLVRARTLPVLTIGDYPEFLDDGGIVNLRNVGGRIRFDLNLAAARSVGLQISSQLARLAVSVRGTV